MTMSHCAGVIRPKDTSRSTPALFTTMCTPLKASSALCTTASPFATSE